MAETAKQQIAKQQIAKQQIKAEAKLTRALKARRPRAVAALYQRYGKLVYSVILRIVKNSAAAEDLTQETFLRAWNRARTVDLPGNALKPWILTVARNRAVDYLRSAEIAKRPGAPKLGWMEHPVQFRDLETDQLSPERAGVLQEAFRKLTASQKTALELAYYEGLSLTEIAARMDQPVGVIRTWLESGAVALRVCLEPA